MSLKSLPVELILDISSHLQQNDEQSLRITCRAFYNLIPEPDRLRFKQTVTFRSRLLRPGNIFASMSASLCGKCHRIRPSSCFPFGSELVVDNYHLCDDCVQEVILKGLRSRFNSYQYRDRAFYACCQCHETRSMVRFLLHPSEMDGGNIPFCSSLCHVMNCHDTECDWHEGDVEKYWTEFNRWSEQRERCECKACKEIRGDPSGEKLKRLDAKWKEYCGV